jgi:hypothetical protein
MTHQIYGLAKSLVGANLKKKKELFVILIAIILDKFNSDFLKRWENEHL